MSWYDSLPASERAELRDAGRIGGSRFEGPETNALLVSVKDAAIMMGGIDTDTVYGMVNSGQIPHVRLGRRILVSVDGLRAWIRANDGRDSLGLS